MLFFKYQNHRKTFFSLVRTYFCKYGVIIWIAHGGADFSGTQRYDSVYLPKLGVRILKKEATPAVTVTNTGSVGPSSAERTVGQVLPEISFDLLAALLLRHKFRSGQTKSRAEGVVFGYSHTCAQGLKVYPQARQASLNFSELTDNHADFTNSAVNIMFIRPI